MATHLAVWLRVTPPPTTLAESSAIFKHLKKQGLISTFIRKPDSYLGDKVASYYATFQREPPSLQTKFEVPVYHNSPNPQDEDPFNIRGLQNRKPLPVPVTFSCQIQRVDHETVIEHEQWMKTQSPYTRQHFVRRPTRYSELHETYLEADAPHGVAEALATFGDLPGGLSRNDQECTTSSAQIEKMLLDDDATKMKEEQVRKRNPPKMNSILEVWKQARAQQKSHAAQDRWAPMQPSK